MPHDVSGKAHALAHVNMNKSLADTDAGDTTLERGLDNLKSIIRRIATEVHSKAVGMC